MREQTLKLKTPLEIGKMSQIELITYIDKLHNVVKDYQIVIDTAILKNKSVN